LKGSWKADPDLSVHASLTASEQDAEKKNQQRKSKKEERRKRKKANTRSKRWRARAAFPMMRKKKSTPMPINPSQKKKSKNSRLIPLLSPGI
jgi:hypothetical protein